MPKNFQIHARIDLHGYTLQAAYNAFSEFMEICVENGFKNLLVITGKSSATSGTINYELPQWCTTPKFSKYISSISQADIKHGGVGAFYIKLN